MRTSTDNVVKIMFTNKLSKTGNLTMAYEEHQNTKESLSKKSKWGAALVAEKQGKGKVRINHTNVIYDFKYHIYIYFLLI